MEFSIVYSEDMRENKISSLIYGRLRDMGFDPVIVNYFYRSNIGEAKANFMSPNREIKKEDLEKVLEGISLLESPLL